MDASSDMKSHLVVEEASVGLLSDDELLSESDEDVTLVQHHEKLDFDLPRQPSHHQRFYKQSWFTRFTIALLLAVIATLALLLISPPPQLARYLAESIAWRPSRSQQPASTQAPCTDVNRYLKQLQAMSEPSIHVFYNGNPVHPADILPAHSSVCLLVTVPQIPLDEYEQAPVPGKGPDSIHMGIHSSEVQINLTPPKPLPGQDEQRLFTEGVIVYYKEVTLHHSGTYRVNADVEHSNWMWALQWHDDNERNVTVYSSGLERPFVSQQQRGFALLATNEQPAPRVVQEQYKFPPAVRVGRGGGDEDEDHRYLPFCSDEQRPLTGQWHAAMSFDVPGGLVDEWGYAWDADSCRMQYYSDEDTMDCLRDRAIYVHGDSNSRRIAKTFISGGHYCHNLSHVCQDFDSSEDVWKLVESGDGGALEEVREAAYPKWVLFQDEWLDLKFGRNSTMMFGFQRTLVTSWADWARKLYDRDDWSDEERALPNVDQFDGKPFRPDVDLKPGAAPRSQPGHRVPDVVVVAVGAWDETYTAYYADLEAGAARFAAAVLAAFPPATRVVLRLTHGTCCQKTARQNTRYSAVRFQHVNEIIQKAFGVEVGASASADGRVLLVDSAPLGATKDEATDYKGHFVAHLRYSRIRTETQMMLNMMCRKDAVTGRASWRWS